MSQTEPAQPDASADDHDRQTLEAELAVLREENRRLRQSYSRAKRATFRRSAVGFLVLGGLALVGAALFPAHRTVFIAFAGTGLFTGIVTYFLTPERFVSAAVSGTVFDTLADTEEHLVRELELQTEPVYVPTPSRPETHARLFIPQHVEYSVPDTDQLGELFVTSSVEAELGVALPPTGDRLYAEFERTISGDLGDDPETIATRLIAALSEQFELVDDGTSEAEAQQAVISVDNPAFGDIHQLDHPIVSLLAVGFAAELDRPVTVETRDDDRYSGVVTVSWGEVGTATATATTDDSTNKTSAQV